MVLSLLVSTRNARNKIIMNLQPAIHPFSLTCPHEGCVEAETESKPKNLRAHEKQNNAPQKACVCVCLSIWLGQQIPTDNGNRGQESKWRIVSPGGSGSGVSGTGGVGSADSSSDRAGSDGIVQTSDLGGTWSDDTETSGSDCCPQVQAGAAQDTQPVSLTTAASVQAWPLSTLGERQGILSVVEVKKLAWGDRLNPCTLIAGGPSKGKAADGKTWCLRGPPTASRAPQKMCSYYLLLPHNHEEEHVREQRAMQTIHTQRG